MRGVASDGAQRSAWRPEGAEGQHTKVWACKLVTDYAPGMATGAAQRRACEAAVREVPADEKGVAPRHPSLDKSQRQAPCYR